MTVLRLSLLLGVLVAVLRVVAPAPLELLDFKALDLRHLARGARPAGGEVVIVALDEASLAAVGRWPWPRTRVADLVEAITAAGPAAIGFDIVFDQRDEALDLSAAEREVAAAPERSGAELLTTLRGLGDRRLAEALRASGVSVLALFAEIGSPAAASSLPDAARAPQLSVRALAGASVETAPSLLDATRLHLPLPDLAKAAGASGHINFLPDIDGFYRRVPVAIRARDRLVPSFNVELVRRYLKQSSATVTLGREGIGSIRIGNRSVAADAAAQVWINYLGPFGTFPMVSAADVLARRVPPERLRGRIVIIGFTAAGNDEVATPFAAVGPGVELQATVVDNLLHDRSLWRPWWAVPAEVVVVVLAALAIGVALDRGGGGVGAAVAALLLLVYAAGSQAAFVRSGLILSALYPLGGMLSCAFGGAVFRAVTEGREKRRIRHAFQHYLSPAVTEMLANDPSRLRLGGERRALTILFSDIRGFTPLAERLPAEVLAQHLNEHLDAMTHAIFRHDGLLDKYIGDALMAFWGAPVEIDDHAVRCCDAALDMLATLEKLHASWRARDLPLLRIGIGINTGEAVVGNFGSSVRFNYTAVGDAVNVAARLESITESHGVRILISQSTRDAVGDAFVCREIDQVRVKGREQPLTVYELVGRRDASS